MGKSCLYFESYAIVELFIRVLWATSEVTVGYPKICASIWHNETYILSELHHEFEGEFMRFEQWWALFFV